MKGPVRFGVIGCGRMGTRRVDRAVAHPEAAVVAVADVDPEAASAVASEYDVRAETDPDAVLGADVDCVVVAVPNRHHVPLARDAMERGRHVFCEKPLARTPAEAAAMVETAAQNDVALKVGSNLRYFQSVRKLATLLEDGAVGEPLFLRGWIGNDGSHLADSWFGDPDLAGGGTFLDNGCHLLDLSRWLLGEPVECVGMTGTVYHDVPVEDNGVGVFRFEGGQLALVQSSWTEWDGYVYLQVYGTEGALTVDVRHPSARVVRQEPGGYREVYDFAGTEPSSYDEEFDAFVTALLADERPEPTGYDGLRAVQMAHAVYGASGAGEDVDLGEYRGLDPSREATSPRVMHD